MSRKPYSIKDVISILENHSFRKAAEIMGMSKSGAQKRAKKFNIVRFGNHKERSIIDFLSKNRKGASLKEIAERICRGNSDTYNALANLMRKSQIVSFGVGRQRRYFLKEFYDNQRIEGSALK